MLIMWIHVANYKRGFVFVLLHLIYLRLCRQHVELELDFDEIQNWYLHFDDYGLLSQLT
jgi:hypothetical protein